MCRQILSFPAQVTCGRRAGEMALFLQSGLKAANVRALGRRQVDAGDRAQLPNARQASLMWSNAAL